MPNVMGREFPYTPEGMAASQQYAQSMGMRDGGPMGFRPVGMGIGGTVFKILEESGKYPAFFQQLSDQEAQGPKSPPPGNASFAASPDRYAPPTDSWALSSFRSEFGREPRDTAELQEYMMSGGGAATEMRDGGPMGFRPLGMQAGGVPVADVAPGVKDIFQGLVDATQSGSTQDVAAYIESNRQDLNDMVSMMMLPQGQADFITNTINSFAPPSVPQMNTPPRGMPDFPGYEPETGDFYPPQQRSMPAPILGPPSDYPSFGDVEEGEQYLIPGTPPPGAVAPIPYDPNEIGVANGGYITRNMNRGGLMSLRRR